MQAQIHLLCSRVRHTEWSGVLFYKVEGQFGSPEFSVTAEELFLMDIGSSSFTEYTMSDPALSRYMVANPETFDMYIGHIHSHHEMAVFFSRTDEDELYDNSEFHSYYLSLIVNNKGESEARIAFRGEVTEEMKRAISYYDNDQLVVVDVGSSSATMGGRFYYKCKIQAAEAGEAFEARFLEVEHSVLERKKKEESPSKDRSSSRRHRRARIPADFEEPSYRGPELFTGDLREGNEINMGTGEEQTSLETEIITLPFSRKQVYDFLAGLVSLDYGYTEGDRLSAAMEAVWNVADFDTYKTGLEDSVFKRYMHCFPGDRKMDHFDAVAEVAIEIMDLFMNEYPEIASTVKEVMRDAIKEQ